MVFFVKALRVIIPREFHHIRAFERIVVPHVVGADGRFCIPLGVVLQHIAVKPLGYVKPVWVDGVVYLVADAPHYNAWVIAVALYPAFHVALGVLDKETVVVHFSLGLFPHVECFAVHQQSHFVAQLHKLSCGHVVRGAYRVHAHLFHDTELSGQRCGIHRGAKRAKVVVHADAVHFHASSIENEPVVRVEFRSAVAEILAHAVKKLFSAVKADFQRVQHRVVYIPQFRVAVREAGGEFLSTTVKTRFKTTASRVIPIRVDDFKRHADISGITHDIGFHLGLPASVGLLLGMYIHPVCCNIRLRA